MSGGLSILMPVFNERATVEAAIDDALTAELRVPSRQLVVVDDGSTDGTRELLASSTFPDTVTVVYHERNLGKGAAVRTALTHADEEFAAILDADLEYHAADLGHVLEPLISGEARVVFGTRAWTSQSSFSFWYVVGNKTVTMATNVLYNCWISDVMTCHKAMHTDLFRSLPLRERDQIDELADVAARAAKHAQRVLEGPDGPLAFALVLGLLAMTEVTISAEEVGAAMIANLLATLPLALARRRISWVTGTIVFGVLFAIATDGGTLTIAALLGLVIALYLFASRYGRRWAVVPAVPFLLNAMVPLSGEDAGISGVLLLMVVVAALALGDSRRQRGEALAERDETRQAMVDTLQDQAAMGERARIARDLHDVVAHHVSAIAVQAESARLTTEGLPEEGRAHFEAIGQTARDALTEMRRLLGVLREDANAEATRDPQPSLARLNDLVETARAAGTPVTLTLEAPAHGGRPVRVPDSPGGAHERPSTCSRGGGRRRAHIHAGHAAPTRPRPRPRPRGAGSRGARAAGNA